MKSLTATYIIHEDDDNSAVKCIDTFEKIVEQYCEGADTAFCWNTNWKAIDKWLAPAPLSVCAVEQVWGEFEGFHACGQAKRMHSVFRQWMRRITDYCQETPDVDEETGEDGTSKLISFELSALDGIGGLLIRCLERDGSEMYTLAFLRDTDEYDKWLNRKYEAKSDTEE